MTRLSFRDRFFTPPVARAIWSPLSIILLGAVTAVGIVVGLPIIVAIAAGLAAYAAKVGLSVPRNAKGERIDPFVLKEPWRTYVQSAQAAKLRFDRTVEGTRSGPIKDSLSQLSARLEEGIEESWRIASRGDDIDGALAQLDTAQAERELAALRAQHGDAAPSPDIEETIQSLVAQISSGQRMQQVSTSTRNRLQLLDARFDELVARAVEVSIGSADSGVLGSDVDDLVNDLEGLRLAMEDTQRAEAGDLTAPGIDLTSPSSDSAATPSQTAETTTETTTETGAEPTPEPLPDPQPRTQPPG